MKPDGKPYENLSSKDISKIRKILDNLSQEGRYVFRYRYTPGSDFETLYTLGILSRPEDVKPKQVVDYIMPDHAREYFGISAVETSDSSNVYEWARTTKPNTLPRFSYKIRSSLAPMSIYTERLEFMRKFIGTLEDEFGKREFEDFLMDADYVKGEAGRLLIDLYEAGIIEKKNVGASSRTTYRIPDDMKELVGADKRSL